MPDFDVVVIGAGAAGLSVAAISAGLGLKVALQVVPSGALPRFELKSRRFVIGDR